MMNLWVRSQDGKRLIPNPMLTFERYENKYSIKTLYGGYEYCLGKYATEERAMEVLDAIQSTLKNGIIREEKDAYDFSVFIGNNIIFKMPKEWWIWNG